MSDNGSQDDKPLPPPLGAPPTFDNGTMSPFSNLGNGPAKPSPFNRGGATEQETKPAEPKPAAKDEWNSRENVGRGAEDSNIKYRFRSVNFDVEAASRNPRTRSYVQELAKMHPDHSGMITQDEFLEFLDDYVNRKVHMKWMTRIVVAVVMYALFVSLATSGLVWAVVALTKDTQAKDGYFVDKSTQTPLATGYTQVATNITDMDEQTLIATYGLQLNNSATLNPGLLVLPQELSGVRLNYYTSFPMKDAVNYCKGLKKAGQNRLSTSWITEDSTSANLVLDMLFQGEVGCESAAGNGDNANEIVTAFTDTANNIDFLLDCKSADDYCHVFTVNFTAVDIDATVIQTRRRLMATSRSGKIGGSGKDYEALVTQVSRSGVDGLWQLSQSGGFNDPVLSAVRTLKAGGLNAYKQKAKELGFRKNWKDAKEEATRNSAFQSTLDIIEKVNSKNLGWKADINKLADLTDGELKALAGALPDIEEAPSTGRKLLQTNTMLFPAYTSYPASYDWSSGVLRTPVNNQGGCSSCWAHGTIDSLSYAAASWGKVLPGTQLSVQQLLSCLPTTMGGPYVCTRGDNAWKPMEYAKLAGLPGVVDWPSVPLVSTSSANPPACPDANITAATVSVKLDNYVRYTTGSPTSEDVLMKATFHTPIAVEFSIGREFGTFTSGVYTPSYDSTLGLYDCEAGHPNYLGLHTMLIVGYGTSETGQKYWIVKNSWGTGVHTQGYMYWRRGPVTPTPANRKAGMDNTRAPCLLGSATIPLFTGTRTYSNGGTLNGLRIGRLGNMS